jgi:hypothetical protein
MGEPVSQADCRIILGTHCEPETSHTDPSRADETNQVRESAMNNLAGCREIELLCTRAIADRVHIWKWVR